MPDELARCLAFVHALEERCAERVERWRFGTALFRPSLPRVWSLNFLRAERDGDAGELAADAERIQGEAGLEHRKVAVRDDERGERLADGFAALGWKAEPLLAMPWAGGGRSPETAGVTEVGRADLRAAWAPGIRSEPWGGDDETVRQLIAQRDVIGDAGRARYFARLVDGEVASYCELYSDGATGQIEGVLTLPGFRGRGFASAVVARALAESQAAGHDLTFLLALEHDWPKELYRNLGFEVAGRIWDFLREPQR